MDQFIILILVVAASIVSSYLQNKKKREEEARERGTAAPGSPPPIPRRRWPQTANDWQDELRRLLEQPSVPSAPPVIVPATKPSKPTASTIPERSEGEMEFASPLTQSAAAFTKASSLHERIQQRMQAVDQTTVVHRSVPMPSLPAAHAAVLRLSRNPQALRDAFIASIIFSPPLAFSGSSEAREAS